MLINSDSDVLVAQILTNPGTSISRLLGKREQKVTEKVKVCKATTPDTNQEAATEAKASPAAEVQVVAEVDNGQGRQDLGDPGETFDQSLPKTSLEGNIKGVRFVM